MKMILRLLMVGLSTGANAQDFEGTIIWSVSYTADGTTHKAGSMNPVFLKSFTMQFGKKE